MNIAKYILAFVIFTLCGCSASGPKFSEPQYSQPNQAQLHVYRRYNLAGIIASPIVYVNGAKQGTLRAGGFISIPVTPGVHEVVVGKLGKDRPNWGPSNLAVKIRAAAGENFYLKLANHVSKVSLSVVDESIGLKEISKTKKSN